MKALRLFKVKPKLKKSAGLKVANLKKASDQAFIILLSIEEIILAKGQLHHSYTF